MYNGKMIVRFDDTNPSKEKDEYVDNILKDLEDLGIKSDKLTYTSDYFEQLLDMANALIKKGVVYADDTPVDIMRQVWFIQLWICELWFRNAWMGSSQNVERSRSKTV